MLFYFEDIQRMINILLCDAWVHRGLVWIGVPGHEMVWYGLGCRGTQWYGMVQGARAHNGLVWFGVPRHTMVWYGWCLSTVDIGCHSTRGTVARILN